MRSRRRRFIRSGMFGGEAAEWVLENLYAPEKNGTYLTFELEFEEEQALFQDSAATTPVAENLDPIGRVIDFSGNENDGVQETDANRLTWLDTDRGRFDLTTDNLQIDFGGAFEGTVYVRTPNGVLKYKISVEGVWQLPTTPAYLHGNDFTHIVAVEGDVTPSNENGLIEFIGGDGKFEGVTDMEDWFRERTDITNINGGDWDVSSVTSLASFIRDATNVVTVDTGGWDTSNVTDFGSFARSANALESADVALWNTSSATRFDDFMRDVHGIAVLDVSGWNTANVTNFQNFARNSGIEVLDVAGWDTSNVSNFRGFARDMDNLTVLDVEAWDTSSVQDFRDFVRSSEGIVELKAETWNTFSVTNFSDFARSAIALETLDVGGWNTASVQNFSSFIRETALTTLNVGNWNTGSVTTFFDFARGSMSLATLDTSSWNTANVTNFGGFIREASSLEVLDVSSWVTSSVTTFEAFARDAVNLHTVIVDGGTGNPFADSPATNYTDAFSNTDLSQESIDAILVAIEAANTSNGTFHQSGGSPPGAAGQDAIAALEGRGWTVQVTEAGASWTGGDYD